MGASSSTGTILKRPSTATGQPGYGKGLKLLAGAAT
jgi:hypothetical protein